MTKGSFLSFTRYKGGSATYICPCSISSGYNLKKKANSKDLMKYPSTNYLRHDSQVHGRASNSAIPFGIRQWNSTIEEGYTLLRLYLFTIHFRFRYRAFHSLYDPICLDRTLLTLCMVFLQY